MQDGAPDSEKQLLRTCAPSQEHRREQTVTATHLGSWLLRPAADIRGALDRTACGEDQSHRETQTHTQASPAVWWDSVSYS